MRPTLATAAIGVVLSAVLAVMFVAGGVQLSDAHTSQRNEIKTEVRDRALLTASLIDSLFGTTGQTAPKYSQEFGSTIARADLDAIATATTLYAAVTDGSGAVLATSTGFVGSTPSLSSAQLTNIASGHAAYFLSDLATYRGNQVVELAVPFTVTGGKRVMVTGISLSALASFFGTELAAVPGVKGEGNYVVDGRNQIIGSSDPKFAAGTAAPGQVTSRTSGESHGTYVQTASLNGSEWRVVLAAPSSQLFASVDGAHQYVPWIIFAALVLVALVALFLGLQALRRASEVKDINARLALVNDELRHANSSLERRAAELARSNEELDSFASIASHDLQEPLRKVRTFNEQLTVLEAANLSDKGRDYLARSNAAAARMQLLIEDLLKFSRVSTQGRPFELVDLSEVAQRVVGDLEGQIAATGAVVEVGALPVITADPLQMHQLLQNLISNGIKFHREGVRPEVHVTGRVEGDALRLEVADNGIGFDPRYAARIFRIFERLNGRTAYPGTGIGLALCRKIADRHGGTIEAIGLPDRGASFIVTLPMLQPEGANGFGSEIRAHSESVVEAETVDA